MSDLLDKLKTIQKNSFTLDESESFNNKDMIRTKVPIINAAFSGHIDGGFTNGLTILSGESKTFKTMLSLYCLKAYQEKYPDSVCLFYDCEFGVTPQYLKTFGIDASRIIHIEVEHIEQMKFDINKRLNELKRGDKVFILVDSLGAMASKKEVDDANDEKSVADMSRAKSIRSLLRIITPHLTTKDIPCIMINHIYKEQGMFPKDVIPGGTAVTYNSNAIFVISKAQEKEGTETVGYKFTINIHKSRFVKEKAKFAFTVNMGSGMNQWSGLLDLAVESGHVKRSGTWFERMDPDTGEMLGGKVQGSAATDNYEFWGPILKDQRFKDFVAAKYEYGMDIEEEKHLQEIEF